MKLKGHGKRERKKSSFILFLKLIPVIALIGAVGAGVMLYEREQPHVSMVNDISLLGPSGQFTFSIIDEKSGLQWVEVALLQGEKKVRLYSQTFIRQGYFSAAGENKFQEKIEINSSSLGLKDGEMELLITARDFSFWNWMNGNESHFQTSLTLDTKPPQVFVMESPRAIKQGGAGVVLYRIGEDAVRHGVYINGFFNPGFPLEKKGAGIFGAMIGLAFDQDSINDAHIVAIDKAGNEGRASFGMIVRNAKFRKNRTINVGDGFLQLKLPEFRNHYPDMAGEDVEQYVFTNSEVRKRNNQKIREVCMASAPERFWEGRFSRLGRSSTQAQFADHRTYFYKGKEIDKQVHLGTDLASTKHAEVGAANHGRIVFAEYLGIYGNTVIIDHGLGLFSLYSHLSQIATAPDVMVKKGDVIGLTGITGMAGGDHLHFSVLINGLFVNPLEWWDAHWLDLNIESILK